MEPRHLRCFVAIVQSQGFRRADRAVETVQGAARGEVRSNVIAFFAAQRRNPCGRGTEPSCCCYSDWAFAPDIDPEFDAPSFQRHGIYGNSAGGLIDTVHRSLLTAAVPLYDFHDKPQINARFECPLPVSQYVLRAKTAHAERYQRDNPQHCGFHLRSTFTSGCDCSYHAETVANVPGFV